MDPEKGLTRRVIGLPRALSSIATMNNLRVSGAATQAAQWGLPDKMHHLDHQQTTLSWNSFNQQELILG
jgi:hypothetical protein